MIVLDETQKKELESLKSKVDFFGCDIVPVPIKNGLYILPESVLSDTNFLVLKPFLETLKVREVAQSEFIESKQ
jgi:hypothetical protein